jgi:dienelactone hydrolase
MQQRLGGGLLALTLGASLILGAGAPAGAQNLDLISQKSAGDVTQVTVSYPAPAGTMRGELFLPAGQGQNSAVLFLHSGEGVDETLIDRCRGLAEQGYVVFAPEYRRSNGSKFDLTTGEVENVLAADDALRNHPRVNPHQVGIIGCSHGSMTAMLAVAEADNPRRFRCVAQASGNQAAKSQADKIKIPVLIQHGAKDQTAPMQDARFLGIEIKNRGNSSVNIKEYTLAGHDLWFIQGPDHIEEEISQSQWAWDDLDAFVGRYLASGSALSTR